MQGTICTVYLRRDTCPRTCFTDARGVLYMYQHGCFYASVRLGKVLHTLQFCPWFCKNIRQVVVSFGVKVNRDSGLHFLHTGITIYFPKADFSAEKLDDYSNG